MKRLSFLKIHRLPLVVITAVVVFLAFVNFTPGSILSGWDNLHPEFNFGLNIRRSLTSVWQEYQGVGLLGGMSHSADLSRQLILFIASFVLSPQLLRYAWVWAMWWFGAMGAYALALLVLKGRGENASDSESQHAARPLLLKVGSLITGMAYLLNLATVQYFYVPYESFSSFYGCLPWLLWVVLRYYQKPTKNRLAAVFVISLLASSAFYVQTLFVVFGLIVAVISIALLASKKVTLMNSVLAALVLIGANLFWFLPSAYFTVTASHMTVDSKINRLSTVESQLMNQSYGTPLNIAMLKGYWFGYQDFQNGAYTYLMPQWRSHVDQGSVVSIGVSLWVLGFLGVCLTVRRNGKWDFSWVAVFTLVTIMMSSGNGPMGVLFSWSSKHIPLFGQIFRTAFTKWSTATALVYALGLGSFSYWMLSKAKQNHLFVSGMWLFVIGTSVCWIVWPAFQGNLLSPIMRLEQPAAYKELFSFFETQPKQTRIVTLPLADFWAWNFYSWNYRGSGFLWYGIEQPILDRNFDVWSSANETFYNQLSTAAFGHDQESFLQLLQKYDVSYALLDESLTSPNKAAIPKQVQELKKILTAVEAQPVWNKDQLTVYKLPSGTTQFVTAPKTYTSVAENSTYSRLDPAYTQLGNTISADGIPATIQFPFAKLGLEELSGYSQHDDVLEISQKLAPLSASAQVVIPPIATGSAYPTQVKITRNSTSLLVHFNSEGTLTVADQTRPLPQLPELTLPVKSALSDASYGSVSFNGDSVILATDSATTTAWITLKANTPISITGQLTTDNSTESVDVPIPVDFWSNLSQPEVFSVPAGNHTAKLSLQTPWTDVPFTGLKTQNCEVFGRGNFAADKYGKGVTYQASNYGSACTGTTLPLLNTKISGLVRFSGQNTAGRSVKFYVSDQNSNRADLEELLSQGKFVNIYTLLDWQKLPAQIYGINWETKSLGSESINRIDQIQVMPLIVNRLSSIRISTSDTTDIASAATQNTVTLSNNWKIGTYQYGTIAKSTGNAGLFTLSQGYNSGWIAMAFPLQNSTSVLPVILKHVTYNGWANGWILPQGEYQVTIMYWPQLLGFAGDGVAILLSVYFAFSSLSSRKKHS